ncbi:MAG: metal ABC transporter ATP-binding protein [Patescibacteria group bacterium]
MQSILSVKNLNVSLEDNKILEDISFSLEAGESMAVIGPNGSGKTVLLKSLLDLIPYSGQVKWAKNVKIGYVPQKIDADRHLPITLLDLLEAKMRTLHLVQSDCREVCRIIGLTANALKTPVGHLSGGQFQKGLIALALLGNPGVLLLDEPTASLDQSSEEHIYELIYRLQEQYRLTIIIVSHDLSMVYQHVDKVLCLNKEGLCFGDPHDVLDPKMLKKLFGTSFEYYHHAHKTK